METWPASFPAPSVPYNGTTAPTVARTEMESGRTHQRRRTTQVNGMVKVMWEFTDSQLAVFAAWVEHVIDQGNAWFKITLPLEGGEQEYTVRFVKGEYAQEYQHVMYWNVTATLELEKKKPLSAGVLGVYLDIGFSETALTNFLDVVENAYTVTHETLPDLLT